VTEMEDDDSLSVALDGSGVIVVRGDIDVAGGPVLDAALVKAADSRPVVIDLGGVYFIDSSGLRCLLGASRRARERGTSVVLRTVGSEVLRLLQITGTADQFTVDGLRD
jgi:anti-sigma B factor antagonist